MRRLLPLLPLLILTFAACDDPKKEDPSAGPTTSAAAKPAVQVVVRTVAIQKTVAGKPPARGEDPETYTALEGKVYAVVSAEIAHNDCKDGEEIDSKQASLEIDGKPAGEVQGGGETPEELCILCQAKAPSGCSGGRAKLKPFTFVFAVDEKADVKTAILKYKGADAKLEVAEVTDRRGNEEIEAQIAEKREQIAAMKKKLETTGNVARGKIIEGEIGAIEKEIADLEAKMK
ncbi:MAG: hypothetical protein RIF41_26590 [Polyangiaceae bacterium]